MKRKISSLLMLLGAVAIFSATTPGCKSKPKDADLKASVESALQANPQTTGLVVDVKDGVATISGQVADPAAQAAVASTASGIKGVKSVNNNVTLAPPPAPVEITADDPLSAGVRDATKDFPGVTASVNAGVISVTGSIAAADWKRLKQALDGLKPKRVDASGLKVN